MSIKNINRQFAYIRRFGYTHIQRLPEGKGAIGRPNEYNIEAMRYVRKLIFICMALVLVGCVAEPIEQPPEMYWPTPPAKPRIKFLDFILGSLDVKGERKDKFKEVLFGNNEVPFFKPSYVKARNGTVFITDVNRIDIYDFPDRKFTLLGGGFKSLTGIDVDDDGSIFIGDSLLHSVFKVSADRKSIKRFEQPQGGFSSVGGLALDRKNGLLYVVDPKRNRVEVFNPDGKYIRGFGQRGVGLEEFNLPYDVAVDAEGNVAVLDSGNFRIQLFSAEGELLSAFGGLGTVPGMLSRPRGISFDHHGHIYVTDAAFGNFQIFDYSGNVYLAVGKNGTEPGSFLLPMGIDAGMDDKIYVVDQINKRIQIFRYLSEDEIEEIQEN